MCSTNKYFLYMFLPSVFLFLIYSAPTVVSVTLSIQVYFKTKRLKPQDAKKNEKKPPAEPKPVVVCSNGDKTVIQKQLSRRRNLKQNIELDPTLNNDAVVDSLKAVTTQKKLIVFDEESILLHDDDVLVGKDSLKGSDLLDHKENVGQKSSSAKNDQAVCDDLKGESSLHEEKLKGILEEQGESSSRNVQGFDQPDTASASNSEHAVIDQPGAGVGEGEEESSDGEDDDEDEAHRVRNNAVEWTEDDQQNLMDLGDSELERNKRLESLIAKRRARKLFKMAIEKKLLDSGNASATPIPPIFTLRNNLLTIMPSSLEESCLPMPGSAPSVLLPGRNPFDLPYDPMEEKPNLMADSFQQEFMAAHQKDTFFCRHESFSLGPYLTSELKQDHCDSRFNPYGLDKKNEDGHRISRFRSQSLLSSHDQLIDELLLQEDETLSRTMSATDLVEMEAEASGTNTEETNHKENKKSGKGKIRSKSESIDFWLDMEMDSGKDNSTDRCSQTSSSEASELSFSSHRPTDIDILEAKVGPRRLSDRVQSDLTFSVPKSIGFDGSPYDSNPFGHDQSRIEDRLFFKGHCHSPGYSIASDLQVEVSEVGSPPFTVDGTVSPADAESLYDGDIDKDIASGSEEMLGAACQLAGVDENKSRSREVSEVNENDVVGLGCSAFKQNLEDPPNASSNISDNDQGHSRNLDISGNDQEQSTSIEKSREEEKVSHDLGDQTVHANNDMAKLELIGEPDGSVQFPINQETSEGPSQPAEQSTSESSIYTDNNSGQPAENQMSIYREPGKIDENEDVGGTSNTIEGILDNLNSVQEGEDKQSIIEVAINQGFDNPATSASPSETVAEQLSTSSCSSPRSVLPGNIPTDEIPSSNYDELVHHIDVPQSIVDEIFRHNSLDEESHVFQNSQLLVDQTNDPISTSTGSGKSEEPSVKVVEGRSESSASPEAATELSEPADGTHLGSVDQSPTLPELETGVIATKLAEEIAISVSDVPRTMAKEEESTNPPAEYTREADTTNNIQNSVDSVNKDEEKLKSVEASKGESPILMSEATEDNKELPKPANSESSLEAIDYSQGESEKSENEPAMKQSIPASKAPEEKEPSNPLPQKSEEEVNTIDNVNETAANEISNNQNLIQQENDMNQSELGENNDSSPDQLKPIESEVKASEQETNTAV